MNLEDGVYAPLTGFMGQAEHEAVVKEGRLPSGAPWPLPVGLPLAEVGGAAAGWKVGDEILIGVSGTPARARVQITEIYPWDKEACAQGVFGTTSRDHPGVKRLDALGDRMVGGRVKVEAPLTDEYTPRALRPRETREVFRSRGWKRVVGFQTRNAPHLGHEALQRHALELADGLLIHPLIGEKKSGDFKDEVIAAAYDAMVREYFPAQRVVFSYFRTYMRYAGPREAFFHALVRRNYGCTHFIVGRDAAGVGNFYTPYASWEIFDKFPDAGIEPLLYANTFHCRRCGGIVSEKTCPHPDSDRTTFKGTEMRDRILRGERPGPHLMRPEVADAILRFKDPFVA